MRKKLDYIDPATGKCEVLDLPALVVVLART